MSLSVEIVFGVEMECKQCIDKLDEAAIEIKCLSFTKEIDHRDVKFIRTEIVLSILERLRRDYDKCGEIRGSIQEET